MILLTPSIVMEIVITRKIKITRIPLNNNTNRTIMRELHTRDEVTRDK